MYTACVPVEQVHGGRGGRAVEVQHVEQVEELPVQIPAHLFCVYGVMVFCVYLSCAQKSYKCVFVGVFLRMLGFEHIQGYTYQQT